MEVEWGRDIIRRVLIKIGFEVNNDEYLVLLWNAKFSFPSLRYKKFWDIITKCKSWIYNSWSSESY